jgi:hypothetical protein
MKLIKLSEYFEIKYGVNLEFQNMKLCNKGIPFVSRTEKNNGITGFVEKINNIIPNPRNTISVACGGSVMESFLQKNDYYNPNIQLIQPLYARLCKGHRLFNVNQTTRNNL